MWRLDSPAAMLRWRTPQLFVLGRRPRAMCVVRKQIYTKRWNSNEKTVPEQELKEGHVALFDSGKASLGRAAEETSEDGSTEKRRLDMSPRAVKRRKERARKRAYKRGIDVVVPGNPNLTIHKYFANNGVTAPIKSAAEEIKNFVRTSLVRSVLEALASPAMKIEEPGYRNTLAYKNYRFQAIDPDSSTRSRAPLSPFTYPTYHEIRESPALHRAITRFAKDSEIYASVRDVNTALITDILEKLFPPGQPGKRISPDQAGKRISHRLYLLIRRTIWQDLKQNVKNFTLVIAKFKIIAASGYMRRGMARHWKRFLALHKSEWKDHETEAWEKEMTALVEASKKGQRINPKVDSVASESSVSQGSLPMNLPAPKKLWTNAGFMTSGSATRIGSKPSGFTIRRGFSTLTSRWLQEHLAIAETKKSSTANFEPAQTPIRRRLKLWKVERLGDLAHSREVRKQDALEKMSWKPYPTLIPSESGDKKVTDAREEAHEANVSNFDEMSSLEHRESSFVDFKKGDVIEIRMANRSILAVFVRRFGRQCQLYTMEGEWMHSTVDNTLFALPGFFQPSEVGPVAKYLPDCEIPDANIDQMQVFAADVPRKSGAHLVNKMQAFSRDANDVFRANFRAIDHVYHQLAAEKTIKLMTLQQIAAVVFDVAATSIIAKPALWAVHRHIASTINFSPAPHAHWNSGKFEILPRVEAIVCKDVSQWVREHQENVISHTRTPSKSADSKPPTLFPVRLLGKPTQLAAFAQRARETIVESRKYRPLNKHGGIGLCSEQTEMSNSDSGSDVRVCTKSIRQTERCEQDVSIIRFLELWAARRVIRPNDPLSAVGSLILRAVGMYEDRVLNQSTGFTLLQELGVVMPWENRLSYVGRLGLPGHNFDAETDKLMLEIEDSPSKCFSKDSMQHLRRDWGNLEVFCIDDLGAKEIDDGFSLETIPGNPSDYWLHTHVANPTAFVPRESSVSQYAARLTESLYCPEKTYSMMLPGLTQNSFSLGPGRPTLTFSAKMNTDGELLDYNVSSGIIQNVTYMTPEVVHSYLGSKSSKSIDSFTFIVGHNSPLREEPYEGQRHSTNMTDDQQQTIKTILQLGMAHQRKREIRGAIGVDTPSIDISVYGQHNAMPCRTRGRRIQGDPTIVASTSVFDPAPSSEARENGGKGSMEGTSSLVRNVMTIACQVAGLWCGERRIPALFRSTTLNPEMVDTLQQYKEQVVRPTLEATGTLPYLTARHYMKLNGRGTITKDPAFHAAIGLDHYVKVTSPLRRYGDMLAHYQIEAALRKEAETGKSLVASEDLSYLPFAHEEVDRLIPDIKERESLIKISSKVAHMHWYTELLYRAHYYNEDPSLPKEFNVYIIEPDSDPNIMRGMVRELNFLVKVEKNVVSDAKNGLKVGDWWRASIDGIETYNRVVYMKPLAFVERTFDI